MSHVDISGWYNSLQQEFRSNSSKIEKVSRRSEYLRKSNLDIVSDFVYDSSNTDINKQKGTCLYEPDLTIHGDNLEFMNKQSNQISSIMDAIPNASLAVLIIAYNSASAEDKAIVD